jgi:hypothetical protein
MEYIYLSNVNDQEHIANYKKSFEAKTLKELVAAYNKEAKCGIVGVRQQALYLIALRQELRERLTESPVYLLEYVLGLVGPIEIVDGHVRIVEKRKL